MNEGKEGRRFQCLEARRWKQTNEEWERIRKPLSLQGTTCWLFLFSTAVGTGLSSLRLEAACFGSRLNPEALNKKSDLGGDGGVAR